MLLRDLKIRTKYPLVIVALALLVAFATGLVAYTHSEREMRAAAELKLLALLESRKAALENYFTSIHVDLRFQARSPLFIDALRKFSWAWDNLGEGQTETLQRLYIAENFNTTGEKDELDSADDGSDYSITHRQFHPAIRNFSRARGYYDIFLFDPDGNLVYSVLKESDYATNLVHGRWKGSDLGKVFRTAHDNPRQGFMAFSDFRPYEPSYGTPASFISTPVLDEFGNFFGVLAFQMPIKRLNEVMQVTAGMGKTGETYVVGRDLLMRSDSRFSADSTILKTRVDTVTVHKALNAETGVEITPDYRGVPVLSAYAPQDFLGVRWAIIAEVAEGEVLAPVYEMRKVMVAAGAVITVVTTVIGIFLALNLSRPIIAMTEAMTRLARRELEIDIPSLNKRDEIGEMASALIVFQKNAFKRKRAEEDLRKSEEALRESEKRLKVQVADLRDREERLVTQSAELAALAEDQAIMGNELKKINDQKDKFFSIIAHDLKSPFTALLGFSDLLASGVENFDHDQVKEYGSAMNKSAQRVFKLLENLLEWSRLQMGRMEFEPGPIDLKEIIDTNLELFEPTAKEKAIRLTGKRRKQLKVFADAYMVDTVIRNLVNNAIKFTPEKGHVTISARQNGKTAEVEVSDTGVGLSANKAARLFRLDEKISTVGTRGETGTGLGLQLCKELVERQGGRINVESTEGEGSVFHFTLPLHQQ